MNNSSALPFLPASPSSTDPVRQYLKDIGRVDLLSAEQELILARLVQRRQSLLGQQQQDGDVCEAWAARCDLSLSELRQALHRGRRAKERMIQANLRLVVSVAKKYQQRGLELLDLVQEGTLGLERGVERFDPSRGFRFSTYAYWWIRQGVTRAIASQSRTIRLPVHMNEKQSRLRRQQRQLQANLGRSPTLAEMAAATGWSEALVRLVLERQPEAVSLDLRVGHDQDADLGDLLQDQQPSPEERLAQQHLHEALESMLQELSSREAIVIRQRFGLEDDRPRTLTQIGDQLQISRERVRQIESQALLKLRQPHHRSRVRDYL